MRLVAYDREKVKNIGGYKMTPNMKIINEFAESNADCVKVEYWTQKHAWVTAQSLNNTMKRMKKTGMRAISRGNEVFMIKEKTE